MALYIPGEHKIASKEIKKVLQDKFPIINFRVRSSANQTCTQVAIDIGYDTGGRGYAHPVYKKLQNAVRSSIIKYQAKYKEDLIEGLAQVNYLTFYGDSVYCGNKIPTDSQILQYIN